MLTTAEVTEEFDKLVLPGLDVPGITMDNLTEKFREYKETKRELEWQWGEWLRHTYAPALTPAAGNVILQKVLALRWTDYIDLEPFYAQEAEYITAVLDAQKGVDYSAIEAEVSATIDSAFATAAQAVESEKSAPAAVQAKRRENLGKWLIN